LNWEGYNGTYSNRQESTRFESQDGSVNILPIVCFESVFGPYCAGHLTDQKGFICMITNDGWWKNTPGYRHHFNFSPVRAIECRRELVRVANNGISALIDARGIGGGPNPLVEEDDPQRRGASAFRAHLFCPARRLPGQDGSGAGVYFDYMERD
jgi:hypothetical protein